MYKGQLEGFPTEIVEKMLERQVEQGNKRDVTVFEADRFCMKNRGGFNWNLTDGGNEFWRKVITPKNFDIFFNKYPKQIELPKCFVIKNEHNNPLWKEYLNWLNNKYNKAFDGSADTCYYGFNGDYADYCRLDFFKKDIKVLTLEQWYDLFIKPTIQTNKMEKEIIGYIVPYDINYIFKKGDILSEHITDQYCKKENRGKGSEKYLFGELVKTWQPAYKVTDVIYTMGKSVTGTFQLVVKDGKCYHNTEDITSYVKSVQNAYPSSTLLSRTFGKYDFNVKDIIISKTGCENVETLLSQWLAIKL